MVDQHTRKTPDPLVHFKFYDPHRRIGPWWIFTFKDTAPPSWRLPKVQFVRRPRFWGHDLAISLGWRRTTYGVAFIRGPRNDR